MRFAFARSGGPLLNWSGSTPPYPARAADTRSLGAWYPDIPHGSTSSALRRYGGRLAPARGAAIPYEVNRQLGSLDLPRPGAPEVVEGYESPKPGAAIVHLGGAGSPVSYPWNEKYPGQTSFGHDCTWDEAHRRAHSLSGYMPEGAARSYGQAVLSADAPPPPDLTPWIRRGSALASVYHGMKRNHGSIGWGLVWGLMAFIAPIHGLVVPVIGAVQGFAQPKLRNNPAKRRHKRSGPTGLTIYGPLKIKRRKKKHSRRKKK